MSHMTDVIPSSYLSPFLFLSVVQTEDGTGDLRINNVQIWHEGRYTCTAQTVVDNDTAYADLKVVGQYQQRFLLITIGPKTV